MHCHRATILEKVAAYKSLELSKSPPCRADKSKMRAGRVARP
jgi:hypothetical protein